MTWTLDKASLKKLATVKPDLQRVIRLAVEISTTPFAIVQGKRTAKEQLQIWNQGRTTKGPIVTWTKKSNHMTGNAIDFAPIIRGKISWDAKYYPAVAEAIKQAGIQEEAPVRWGVDMWGKDFGHIELQQKNAPT